MEDELIEFSGFITFYKFENIETNYRIAIFKIDDNSQERNIIITGYFPRFTKNDNLTIKTRRINHPKFGIQFEVIEFNKKLPKSKDNIVKFLSSSSFKGIGKKKALKIYEIFKDDTIDKLVNDPNNFNYLYDNNIINDKELLSLKEGLKEFDFKSNAYMLLLKYGFSTKNIMKAESFYGETLENVLKENPYQLAIDIQGIGFKSIDLIAKQIGIEDNDPRRIKAAILATLNAVSNLKGDTYLDFKTLYQSVNKIVYIEVDIFNQFLNELNSQSLLKIEDDRIYDINLYKAEISIIKELKYYIYTNINRSLIDNTFSSFVKKIENDNAIIYSKEQLEAIYNSLINGIYIITGGPGTGKTTILNAIIQLLKIYYGLDVNITLIAPTGRAAKRMSYLSNTYASTIHRFLKWDLHSNSFTYNENNKVSTDIIIIDEFSMVDTLLFSSLLKGTKDVKQMIIIGDDHQIPSVSSGNMLNDLLQIESIHSTSLSKIYRQSDNSSIVTLASDIRNLNDNKDFKYTNEVKFYNLTVDKLSSSITKIIDKNIQNGLSFNDFQVIIPRYAGVGGIDNVNAYLQDYYNPPSYSKNEVHVTHQIIREGDIVLLLKNQPEDDIFNGDIGKVLEIDLEDDKMFVEFDVGVIEIDKINYTNLTLAYAISIHKSQGSEFNNVIIPIFKEYGTMLDNRLIYTAITRAKSNLYLLGDYKYFTFAKLQKSHFNRKTTLLLRAKDYL